MFKVGDIVKPIQDWYISNRYKMGVVQERPFADNTGHTRVKVLWSDLKMEAWDVMMLELISKDGNDILKDLCFK